jgi:CheY-like chemotaxis protein
MGTSVHNPPSRVPRILLVEDDPISQTYLRAVLENLPALVDTVSTQACALARGTELRHELWLIDLSLPDGTGSDLLAQLRLRWPDPPPALAHTADADPAVRAPALRAGFRDVLVKPLATAAVCNAVRAALASAEALPDWDNAVAEAALNHNPANIKALRQLFLDELPDTRAQVVESARRGDEVAVKARLHRLQASCGLVGATRLGAAVESLRRAPESLVALENFDHAIRDLIR